MSSEDWNQDEEYAQVPHFEQKKLSLWQRMGGKSLTIAILIHAILLIIGAYLVIQVIREPEKKVDFMPPAGGGGSQNAAVKPKQNNFHKSVSRVVAIGGSSTFSLPEPEMNSDVAQIGDLVSGSAGLGGSGSGGGKGNGVGKGVGDGTAPGLGGKGIANPFGATEPGVGGLVGTFYDLKQANNRKENDMTQDGGPSDQKARGVIREFVSKGFKDNVLKDYYQASVKLYQTKFLLPEMSADAAPAAFQCEKEVRPKRWIVVYRGEVKAPKTGKFRFVGAGDDCLVVRFNSRLVFDHGYTSATLGREDYRDKALFDVLDGKSDNKELIREVKKVNPMEIPTTFYTYSSTRSINEEIHGYAVGPMFEVRQNQTYPIEILISEIPGGRFQAGLMIQEEGVTYEKDSTGSPILPLFRTDSSLPDKAQMKGQYAPFAPAGPVFSVVKSTGIDGI
jgi:hypothetical protein